MQCLEENDIVNKPVRTRSDLWPFGKHVQLIKPIAGLKFDIGDISLIVDSGKYDETYHTYLYLLNGMKWIELNISNPEDHFKLVNIEDCPQCKGTGICDKHDTCSTCRGHGQVLKTKS